ncbi:hypothetical protein A2380_00850 [candidate division WWE3 bacterium RIFOXYB1_FULL_43_24]|uniref:DUF2207 domain-containing protein n=1 Tax=candidate division WWE3 bacterium GW2011_GWF1_42_14 TaxID=1619138 RepID=A0A0G0YRP1_UNCKA|nr:MAG: hypothetical protein UU92_C0005G0091 [candidate division WWE3 bacterium GW2011_GWA1_42_12]KKS34085.1 MAG: hypothetical protein UU97_C0015G0018 [candidate division WWE3 bacterium GW2011_GWD1_42_14]KKS39259.1 MAG: hypothetical protein UV00_C0003G0091 [candidate division WWE3 bacterium GW2011_GWF1_42_14]KKS40757.1 MAG: hypothetical protein UV03_C0003G0070 [candidate division WWE3 bacterium GW2011_GWE1_42_16]OGC60115.1 MAG: hypothetical protein A2212_00405 [candidate division WWE3 bacterium
MSSLRKISILIFSLFIFFAARVSAQELIQALQIDSVVNKDGTVRITETMLYDFGNEQRHGIFRYIPYKKVNQDGKSYVMDITVEGVSDEKGNGYRYSVTKSGNDLTIKIGDPDKTVSGQHIYIISYRVNGSLTYFDTYDEFYWNGIGSGWDIPINLVRAEVNFGQSFGEGELDGVCYTGLEGSTNKECAVDKLHNGVTFTTNKVNPGEAFTFAVKFPKGYAAVLEPAEDKPSTVQLILMALAGIVAASFYVFLPIFLLIKWLREKKHVRDTARIVAAWFSPPKTADGEALTPVETVITADVTAGNKAVPATIISLAQRGYIKITQKEKKEFIFSKTEKPEDDLLRQYEKDIYTAIFSEDAIEVSTKKLSKNEKFGVAGTSLASEAADYLKKTGVFKSNPVNTSGGYLALSIMSFFTGNIFLAAVSFILGRKSPKRPDSGIQTYSEAVSLKNFLVSQDPQFDFQAQEMMFFEKLLPYATAFGVEDVWIKRFKDLFNTNPEWYRGDDFTRLVVLNSIVNSSYHSASASSRSSSGFGSGFSGGSSGGGGGGGGGGSW